VICQSTTLYDRAVNAGEALIAVLEGYFAEELTAGLAQRAQQLDGNRRAELRELVEEALATSTPDQKPSAHVRPLHYRSYANRVLVGSYTLKNAFVPVPPLEHLLLYFHSVAVLDTLAPALHGAHGRDGVDWAVRWLAAAAPLIRADLLVVCDRRVHDPDAYAARGELIREAAGFTLEEERDLWVRMCDISGLDPRIALEQNSDWFPFPAFSPEGRAISAFSGGHEIDIAKWDATTALELAGRESTASTDLWLAKASHGPVLSEIANRLGDRVTRVPPSGRLGVMAQLHRLELPGISRLSVADLLAIRRNEDIFAEWREALSGALHELPDGIEPTNAHLSAANEILREGETRLSERRRRLPREILTGEARNFGIAALSSAASGAIFGLAGLGAAVTASGAAAALRAAGAAARAQSTKQTLASAERHYAVFAPET
jgi:hypothetical protein